MERIKKNFGFGCMRLPMKDGEVDTTEMNRMVDAFLDSGFNYFDTAHGYLGGKAKASECIKCGKYEKACPQHLRIRDLLVDVAKEFEKK